MHDLIGTWRLVEWTVALGDRTVKPFGGKSTGLLTYTQDGRMTASLMRMGRSSIGTTSFAEATSRQRAAASTGYISYAGSYHIDGDLVHHQVELSLFPDWEGDIQTRRIAWVVAHDGTEQLELSYVQNGASREATNTLLWRRVMPEGSA
jgi:hypothetical protein